MNEINKYGIFLLDIYLLNYYGVKVFFQVCKTTKETVFLIELATKETKEGIMLTKRIKASKKPLIIRENNTHTKSKFEVKPIQLNSLDRNDYWLPIDIKVGDPIWNEAQKYNEFPSFGVAYAVKITDVINKYWEKPCVIRCEEDEVDWA